MDSFYLHEQCENLRHQIYLGLNRVSNSNSFIGRLGSIPVALLDITLETLDAPLRTIDHLARLIFNIVGVVLNRDGYSVKKIMFNAEYTLGCFLHIPVSILMSPFKLTYQFFAILVDPIKVREFNYYKNTFRA